jgi:adenine-specific DNA methylase
MCETSNAKKWANKDFRKEYNAMKYKERVEKGNIKVIDKSKINCDLCGRAIQQNRLVEHQKRKLCISNRVVDNTK